MKNCIDTKSHADADPSGVRAWFRTLLRRLTPPVAERSAAPAMLMLVRDIGPLVTRVSRRLERCGDRRRERRRLLTLDDRALRDIGVSRADVEYEYRKPPWRD